MTIETIWATVLSSVATLILGYITAKLRQREQQHKRDSEKWCAMEQGLMALLRDRIYEIYVRAKDNGYKTRIESRNMESIYTAYEKMGGNGTAHSVYEKFLDLPIEGE